jgi:hypothetical protein
MKIDTPPPLRRGCHFLHDNMSHVCHKLCLLCAYVVFAGHNAHGIAFDGNVKANKPHK